MNFYFVSDQHCLLMCTALHSFIVYDVQLEKKKKENECLLVFESQSK